MLLCPSLQFLHHVFRDRRWTARRGFGSKDFPSQKAGLLLVVPGRCHTQRLTQDLEHPRHTLLLSHLLGQFTVHVQLMVGVPTLFKGQIRSPFSTLFANGACGLGRRGGSLEEAPDLALACARASRMLRGRIWGPHGGVMMPMVRWGERHR